MARFFVDADADYLEWPAAILTDYPYTMVGRFKTSSLTVNQIILGIFDAGNTNRRQQLHLNTSGAVTMASHNGTTLASATATLSATANVWGHAAGVVRSATDRQAWFNGGATGTDATNVTFGTPFTRTWIGRRGTSTPQHNFRGYLEDVALYRAALLEGEIQALSAGASPLLIRPDALVGYWPLISGAGQEPDYSPYQRWMQVVNTPAPAPSTGQVLDPRLLLRPPGWHARFALAAAPTGILRQMMSHHGG
jgi:hypothetical protein